MYHVSVYKHYKLKYTYHCDDAKSMQRVCDKFRRYGYTVAVDHIL